MLTKLEKTATKAAEEVLIPASERTELKTAMIARTISEHAKHGTLTYATSEQTVEN